MGNQKGQLNMVVTKEARDKVNLISKKLLVAAKHQDRDEMFRLRKQIAEMVKSNEVPAQVLRNTDSVINTYFYKYW